MPVSHVHCIVCGLALSKHDRRGLSLVVSVKARRSAINERMFSQGEVDGVSVV